MCEGVESFQKNKVMNTGAKNFNQTLMCTWLPHGQQIICITLPHSQHWLLSICPTFFIIAFWQRRNGDQVAVART